jgi:CRISPR-associated protein Cmr3
VRLPLAPADPAPTAAALDTSSDLWVTLTGLQRILHGDLPAVGDLVPECALWAGEGRVGIERAPGSHTVVEGALYSTRHVRPDARVSLGVDIDGVPASWSVDGDVIPLGGESRLAACTAWPAGNGVSFEPAPCSARTAVIVALTPVLLDTTAPGSELTIPGARIISACIDRPLRIGGWDSLARAPLPLRNAAAPGSVWFCQLDDPDAFHKTITNGVVRAGAATAMGFGLCATGSAPHWETLR